MRRAELRAIAPTLPAPVAASMLTRLLRGGQAPAGTTGTLAAGAAGKSASLVMTAKAIAAAAVIGTSAVGSVALIRHTTSGATGPSSHTIKTGPARTEDVAVSGVRRARSRTALLPRIAPTLVAWWQIAGAQAHAAVLLDPKRARGKGEWAPTDEESRGDTRLTANLP
jgi:hypothetical protein